MNDRHGWTVVGSRPPEELREDIAQVHWATQLIASAGQAWAQPRDDDSHRAMAWDAALGAFVGVRSHGDPELRLALRPNDLTVLLLAGGGAVQSELRLLDRTLEEGYAWLAEVARERLGDGAPAVERPEYDMPPHPVGEGAPFTGGNAEGRHAVANLYGTAAEMLGLLISTRDDASPVLCWPHHFDIATLLTVGTADDGRSQTVGVGLAPNGGGFDDWYWYVSPYPYPESNRLPELAGPGHWHTEGWTGAVLPGSHLHEADPSFREAVVRKFLDVAVEAATRSLRES